MSSELVLTKNEIRVLFLFGLFLANDNTTTLIFTYSFIIEYLFFFTLISVVLRVDIDKVEPWIYFLLCNLSVYWAQVVLVSHCLQLNDF